MARTKGSCQETHLIPTGKGLADEVEEGHGEANGHVLVKHFGLWRIGRWSARLLAAEERYRRTKFLHSQEP